MDVKIRVRDRFSLSQLPNYSFTSTKRRLADTFCAL